MTAALVAGLVAVPSAAFATPDAEEPAGAEAPRGPLGLMAPDPASAATIAALEGEPVEVVGERTESSSTWALPNGTFASSLAAGPVWVRRGGDGTRPEDWAQVDLTLEAAADGSVRPKAHPAEVVLAGEGTPGDGRLLSLERAGKSLGVAWEGPLPQPRLEGPRAVYPQVEPGVDLVVEMTRTGYEQFFVLTDRPAAEESPELSLAVTAPGLTATAEADGAVAFEDAAGEVVARSGTPLAWDAAVDGQRLHPLTEPWTPAFDGPALQAPDAEGRWPEREVDPAVAPGEPDAAMPASSDVTAVDEGAGQAGPLEAAEAGASPALPLTAAAEVTAPDTVEFALTPDEAFLQDPDTVFPLVVDPDATLGEWFDTWVQHGVSTDQSGSQELRIGTYNSGGAVARSFLNVDMTGLEYKEILDADLQLYNWYSWSCTARGWEVWSTGTADTGTRIDNQPTWVKRWGYSTETRGYSSACAGDYVGADVTDLVQAWSNNARKVVGMGIKANNEADNMGWKKFISGNNPDGPIPHLNIVYNTRPRATSFKVDSSVWGWTNQTNPELSAVVVDPDPGARVDMEFQVYNAGGTRELTETRENLRHGEVAKVKLPDGLVEDGKTYSVVVVAHDGAHPNETNLGPVTFTVDTTDPLAPAVSSAEYPDDGDWHGDVGQQGTFTFTLPGNDPTLSRFEWEIDDEPTASQNVKPVDEATGSVTFTPERAGRHELRVRAVDKAANTSGTVSHVFYVGRGGLAAPAEGDSVARRVRLVPEADDDLTHVAFQWRRGPDLPYHYAMDPAVLTRADGTELTAAWTPIADLGGYATWDAGATLGHTPGPVQVRALLATDAAGTGQVEGQWVTVTVDPDVDHAASAGVGPGEVNLLTGDYTLSATDVDEFGMAIGRTASSRDPRAGLEPQAELLSDSQQQMSATTDITGVNATVSVSDYRWHADENSLRIRPSGASPNSYAYLGAGGDIGLEPGRSYRVSGWLHVPTATGLDGGYQHGLKITAWSSTGGSTPTVIGASDAPTRMGMFQELSLEFTVPAGADSAFIRLNNGFDDPDQIVYWDDVSVREIWAPLGPEWTLGTANEIGSSAFTYLDRPEDHAVTVHLAAGGKVWFTGSTDGTTWHPQRGAESLTLTKIDADTWTLTDLAGTVSTFTRHHATSSKFELTSTSPRAGTGQARLVYEKDALGRLRLTRMIAPVEPGVDGAPTNTTACTDPTPAVGCRVLELFYSTTTTATASAFGAFEGRLRWVRLHAADDGTTAAPVQVARYNYDADGRLREVFDPRISPALTTSYAYDADGRVVELTPPGELPWTFDYGVGGSAAQIGDGDVVDRSSGRLYDVSRPSLVPGTDDQVGPDTVTTMVYAVPLTRADGGPHDLDAAALQTWAQGSAPTDATAIFGPEDVPGLTTATPTAPGPDGYGHAVVHYLDSSGREVNTAAPAGPGAPPGVGYVETNEYDEHGNIVRTLTAGNRLLALGQVPTAAADLAALDLDAADTATRARALSSFATFDDEGIDLLRSRGPLVTAAVGNDPDDVRLAHPLTSYIYDEGKPDGVDYHLLTTQTSGLLVAGSNPEELLDVRVTSNQYDPIDSDPATGRTSGWTLGAPTVVIADAGGANLTSRVRYDEQGRTVESRHVGATGTDARTTRFAFYTAGTHTERAECGNKPAWAGLPCTTWAAGAVTGHDPGRMAGALPVTTVTDYSRHGAPEAIVESATGPVDGSVATQTRTATTEFDPAGRPLSSSVATTGPAVTAAPMPITEVTYDPATGRAVTVSSVDPAGGTTVLSTISKVFDDLGRMTRYTDAAGGWTDYVYDEHGKPVQTTDSLGTSRTVTYDRTVEPRGFPTSVTDSVAGTFTAAYGPDGELLESSLPGGVRLEIGYDANRSPVSRKYVRASDDQPVASSVVVENAAGQWISHTTDAASKQYVYDDLGRLTDVRDTVAGACTWRRYEHNDRAGRTGMATAFSASAECADPDNPGSATVGTVDYSYDSADRLVSDTATGAGRVYDPLGRMVTAPASSGPGIEVGNEFYATDMIATQTIDGLARQTFTLDPAGRFTSSTAHTWTGSTWQAGATTVNHYGSDADSPSWVVEDTTLPDGVTRYVPGMDGGLAVQTGLAGQRLLMLTDLRGDIMATLPVPDGGSEAGWTGLQYRAADEFGNPTDLTTGRQALTDGTAPDTDHRYGWLGTHQRSADALGGVLLMGVRLYDPATGRFQSVDSVRGGNATEYDYCAADPVNCTDLSGRYIMETSHDRGPGAGPRSKLLQTAPPVARKLVNYTTPSAMSTLKAVAKESWSIFRAAKNAPFTSVGRAYGELTGGNCRAAEGRMYTCTGGDSDWIPRGGVAIGNTFVTHQEIVTPELLRHETKHADQWAIFGPVYVPMYFTAEGVSLAGEALGGGVGCWNVFEIWAGLGDGGYFC